MTSYGQDSDIISRMKEASLDTFLRTILARDSEKLEDIALSCRFWPQVGVAMAVTVVVIFLSQALLYCIYRKFCSNVELGLR
jgi:hypothetical protein